MANDVSCCRVLLLAYTFALTHQIHVIGTNTTDSTLGNTADSTIAGQQSTNAALTSTVTTPASTGTVTPTSTYSSACENLKANCSSDFKHFYVNLTDIDIHSCQSQTAEQCYKIIPINNCTQLQAQLKTNGSFGLLCSPSGLQVFRYNYSCPANVLSFLNSSTLTFCGLKGLNCTLDANSSLTKIDENTLLKPSNCPSTTKKPATTDIPLTPNPVGPAAITAIVVLVCLTIVAILAGFFFWPKCHNPQAPPLKKKTPPPVDPTPQVAYSVSRKQATVSLPPGSIGHNAV